MPGVVVVGEGEWSAAVIGEALDGHPAPWVVGVAGAATLGVLATADAGEVVRRLTATVELVGPGLGSGRLRVGVSDPVTGPAGLLAAVAEARAVAATGAGRYAVAGPDRLASSALLLAAVPAELRRAYVGPGAGTAARARPRAPHRPGHHAADLPRLLRVVGPVCRTDAPAREHVALPGRADRGPHRPRPAPPGRPGRSSGRRAAVRRRRTGSGDAGGRRSGDAGGRRSGDA